MEFNTILLFIIASVITIYFTWNFFNNRKLPKNSKLENDIRYYELKSKYEFLVAVVSLVTAVAVFYGLGTKKDIEQNIKSEFTTEFEPAKKRLSVAERQINEINMNLKTAQGIINSYYNALKEIDTKQKTIDQASQRSQKQFQEFEKRIDTLNKKNILKKNFYLVDNIKVNYDVITYNQGFAKFAFDTLTTTLGDKLPKFQKPPLVVAVSDVGNLIEVYNVTNSSFGIHFQISVFDPPKSGVISVRLMITEVE